MATQNVAPRDTRAALIEHAAELLETHGYNGFSYNDLSERLQIRRASIHHHFPHKEDLGLALIDAYRAHAAQERERLQTAKPKEQLAAFFQAYRRVVAAENRICASGALETDLPALSSEMRESLRLLVRESLEWLTGVLEAGRALGCFDFPEKSKDRAILILAAVQGAVQMGRAFSPMFFAVIESQLLAGLGATAGGRKVPRRAYARGR